MNDLTAAQMIDIAGMKAIYGHLKNDPEIEHALIVDGEEKDLAEIGQWMIDGNVEDFEKAMLSGRIKMYYGTSIPSTNAIYCLYLPPYYVFVDLKRLYC
ncbi:MAG TPA: hypothetical protein VN703_02895 [Candidatus Sulfopaludibacter sp.]|nr:hypothetical protein [Candidatus Sulfopaludibacter sp.]